MYALNLDKNHRVLSATYEEFAQPGQPLVEHLPDGNIGDYIYQNEEYIYSPIPEQVETLRADRNYTKDEFAEFDGRYFVFLENVPAGVSLVTGQNVNETTMQDYINSLKED